MALGGADVKSGPTGRAVEPARQSGVEPPYFIRSGEEA
jgi:hypothetical protein